ncbi:MAG TPA: carbon-nitrogen hydrolase family protein [Candidatus Thermoplasmatota archaeon]|nr:carbon-nitrogen hydrolase family protein [Candidatus Thermoplasmatota archaeon]
MRVCAVQMPHGDSLEENLRRARDMLADAAARGAALALLPEYFFAVFPGGPPASAPHAPRIRAMMADASRELGLVVAGNVIEGEGERYANVGVAFEAGRLVLEQAKVHPMPREAAAGVAGGPSFRAARVGGHDTGMLVCADVLYPEAARVLSLQGAEILLNPVMSPWREEDDGREARVAMYVARAYDAGAFVLKAAGHKRGAVAGRSLIAAPWGVLARASDDFATELVLAELDFAKLRAFREKQAQFPPRRPEAYQGLL